MPWTDKTAHILYRRRYHCDVCDHTFDMRHAEKDAPMPDCPNCIELGKSAAGASVAWVPPMPAIGTTKGKAIDLAQKIAEEDWGMTNLRDNQRTGDLAFLPDAPVSTAQAERELREIMEASAAMATQLPPDGPTAPDGTRSWITDKQAQRDNFFQGNLGGSAEQTIGQAEVAREASAAARLAGTDPVDLLERGRASGNMPLRLRVMGEVAASELPEPLQRAQAARGT